MLLHISSYPASLEAALNLLSAIPVPIRKCILSNVNTAHFNLEIDLGGDKTGCSVSSSSLTLGCSYECFHDRFLL